MSETEINNQKQLEEMNRLLQIIVKTVNEQNQQFNAISNKIEISDENQIKNEDTMLVVDAVETNSKKIEKVGEEVQKIGKKGYQITCGTENILEILKCILDAILFVAEILKKLLNIRDQIKKTLKNIPLVSTIIFIIDILILWCYIYVVCLVLNYIGCKIGNPKLAEDTFKIFIRYTIKLFEFACNPKVIKNTSRAFKTGIDIINTEISKSDFAVSYESGKGEIVKNVDRLKSVLNFVNDGFQTMKNDDFSNVVINKVNNAASTFAEGTYNSVSNTMSNTIHDLQDLTVNMFFKQPDIKTIVTDDMTYIIDGGKKTQKNRRKRRKRRKTNKRKSKSRNYLKGGNITNKSVNDLSLFLSQTSVNNFDQPLKDYQDLAQKHNEFVTPIFELLEYCRVVSEEILSKHP